MKTWRLAAAWGPSRAAAPSASSRVRRAAELWWLHPSLIILLVVLPVYLSVLAYDFKQHAPLVYVPGWDYTFGLVMLLAMVTGVQLALAHRHTVQAVAAPQISLALMMLLLVPTLVAYAVWFGPVLQRPELLMEVVRGERPEIRDDISTVKGVTTFTQFGLAYVIAFAVLAGSKTRAITRIEKIGFVLIFVLACFRALDRKSVV